MTKKTICLALVLSLWAATAGYFLAFVQYDCEKLGDLQGNRWIECDIN